LNFGLVALGNARASPSIERASTIIGSVDSSTPDSARAELFSIGDVLELRPSTSSAARASGDLLSKHGPDGRIVRS
jgi:hypothetical protein